MQDATTRAIPVIFLTGREDTDERREQLAGGTELLREAIGELRSLRFELSPPVLREHGLPAALDRLAAHTRDRWGVALRCVIAPDLAAIRREQAVILFQCARELVHNRIKYADARAGRIALSGKSGGLYLSVEDDGKGVQPPGDLVRESRTGFSGFSAASDAAKIAAVSGRCAPTRCRLARYSFFLK